MNARVLLLPALLALSVMGAAPSHHAALVRVGLIAGPARRQLVADWDAQTPNDIGQVERAYCVVHYTTFGLQRAPGDTLVLQIVTDIEPAAVDSASRWSIRFRCHADERGLAMPTIHTHPATRCNPSLGLCLADSSQMTPKTCGPSDTDVLAILASRQPYAIVQCGRDVWTFYTAPRPT